MSNHLGKRERMAGKRKKRIYWTAWSGPNGSGSLTLKIGKRKRMKLDLKKAKGLPF